MVPEGEAGERFLRYEGSLERSIDRTLQQLERLQRMRLGQPVPPTLKADVSREYRGTKRTGSIGPWPRWTACNACGRDCRCRRR